MIDGGMTGLNLSDFDSLNQAKMAAAVVKNLKGLGVKKLNFAKVAIGLDPNHAPDPTPRINPHRPFPEGGFGKPFVP